MRPRRDEFRSRWRVLAALAVLWLAACGGGPGDGPGDTDVDAGDSIDASGEVDRPDASSFGHIGDDCTRAS
jgi:hypothetical protein